MRTLISVLAVSGLLVSCVNKSSDEVKPNPFAFTEDFRPTEKPANAAPDLYVKDILAKLKDSEKVTPDNAAFFSSTIKDSKVVPVDDNSEERIKAMAKLDVVGKDFLNQVKANCLIQNPTLTETGSAAQGAVTTSNQSFSTSGPNCPLLVKTQNSTSTTYTIFDIDQAKQRIEVEGTVNLLTSTGREIKDEKIVLLSGFRSLSAYLNGTGSFTMIQTSETPQMSNRIIAEGKLEVVLANGDVISGVIKMEAIGVNEKTETRVLVDAQSKLGAIRFVTIKKSDSAVTEVYLNGEAIDPSIISGLNLDSAN